MPDPRELLDQSRQWGESRSDIETGHVARYALATIYAEGRILDAACGCGYGSALLAKKGAVTGIDRSREALDWAEKYFPGPTYKQGNIEEVEGEYETVVSLETIEHLQDPDKALQRFRKACVGLFIASVPNETLYPFKAESFAGDESPHYRHYTPEEFERLLVGHGFKVLGRFCQVSKLEPMPVYGVDGRFLVYVCG